MIGQRQTPLGSIPGGWSELNLAKYNPDNDSTSANGILLPRADAAASPQPAEADVPAFPDPDYLCQLDEASTNVAFSRRRACEPSSSGAEYRHSVPPALADQVALVVSTISAWRAWVVLGHYALAYRCHRFSAVWHQCFGAGCLVRYQNERDQASVELSFWQSAYVS